MSSSLTRDILYVAFNVSIAIPYMHIIVHMYVHACCHGSSVLFQVYHWCQQNHQHQDCKEQGMYIYVYNYTYLYICVAQSIW